MACFLQTRGVLRSQCFRIRGESAGFRLHATFRRPSAFIGLNLLQNLLLSCLFSKALSFLSLPCPFHFLFQTLYPLFERGNTSIELFLRERQSINSYLLTISYHDKTRACGQVRDPIYLLHLLELKSKANLCNIE